MEHSSYTPNILRTEWARKTAHKVVCIPIFLPRFSRTWSEIN